MTSNEIFQVDRARVQIDTTKADSGEAAGTAAARLIRSAIAGKGAARIIVATGNSQLETVATLTRAPDIAWSRVTVFHMDEYAGMSATHPASFRRWVKERLVDLVHPGQVHYLTGDASDLDEECRRYGELLLEAPVDLCLLGIGENGHIAFNDPHVADFNDPRAVKRVSLDVRCRMQQVGEGHFASFELVPLEALTLTIPTLMRPEHLVCSVPEKRKAEAVRNALEGPLTPSCPGSIVRTHSNAQIFLDAESASLLSRHS